MKISELIDRLTVDPKKDIEPHFKLDKELSIDTSNYKGCLNCSDKASNNIWLQFTASWTRVQHCRKCAHLNVVYVSDRMGGTNTDTVYCYTDYGQDNATNNSVESKE